MNYRNALHPRMVGAGVAMEGLMNRQERQWTGDEREDGGRRRDHRGTYQQRGSYGSEPDDHRYGEDQSWRGRSRSDCERSTVRAPQNRDDARASYGFDDESAYDERRFGSDARRQSEGSQSRFDRPGASSAYDDTRGGEPGTFTYTEVWLIEGPQSGRGPKGYKRSDDRIKEDVCDRLGQHGQVDASEIDVSLDDGVVTLEGTVDDRRTKRLAEDAAASVQGVRDVMNHLKVDAGFFAKLLGRDEDDRKQLGKR
jgi:hypothetical protein